MGETSADDGTAWRALEREAEPEGVPEAGRDEDSDELTIMSLEQGADGAGDARRRGRWHLWYRAVGALALVALVAAFGATLVLPRLPKPTIPKPPPEPLPLDLTHAGMDCVDGIAWSPDGTQLVALGAPSCAQMGGPHNNGPTEELVIFEVKTGRPVRSISFGETIAQQVLPPSFRQNADAQALADIAYSQPLWSPDGRSVVLSFNAYAFDSTTQNASVRQYGWGLAVVTLASGTVRVIEGPLVVQTAGGTGQPGLTEPYPAGRWDLRTGTMVEESLEPGLAYMWTSQDELVPTQPLPSESDTSALSSNIGRVGNPMGGRAFTVWQSGMVGYASANYCPQQNGASPPGPAQYTPGDYYVMFLNTPAWSPDGRYLIWGVGTQGRLPFTPAPPAPAATPTATPLGGTYPPAYDCSNFGPAPQYPVLPVRDAGLKAAVAQIALNTQPSITMTWRPDGKALAVAPGDVESGEPALTIYACATGRAQRQFSLSQIEAWAGTGGQAGGSPFTTMAWSPDGSRLALVSPGPIPAVLVMGPKTLGM